MTDAAAIMAPPLDEPRFSRSGDTNPLGKCDARLDVPVPEQLAEQLAALAAIAGVSKAEYVRGILMQHVFGAMAVLRQRVNQRV